MESTTHKQLAQSATQKANSTTVKIGALGRELDNVSEEDTAKRAGLKNRILSLQSQSQGHQAQAAEHRSDAVRAEIKENDKAFKEIEEEQKTIQKEEQKQQQKIEKELEDKSAKNLKKNGSTDDLDKDFGEELLFLSDNNEYAPAAAEDVVDFNPIAKPVEEQTQATNDSTKKNEEEQHLIKGAGAAATGT